MRVVNAQVAHAKIWTAMRLALWPDGTAGEHAAEIAAMLSAMAGADADPAAFIALSGDGEPIGFAEASLRHDYVNGCETSPVAFLESIFVMPEKRGDGVGRALCDAVAQWGRVRGCTELGSDADLANDASHAFHAALGFGETERVVFFRRMIG